MDNLLDRLLKIIAIFLLLGVLLFPLALNESFALLAIFEKTEIEIFPGETKTFEWGLTQQEGGVENLVLSISGNGTEFITFEENLKLVPGGPYGFVEFTVTIPEDHEGNITLMPKITAKENPELTGGAVTAVALEKIVTLTIKEKVPDTENGGGCLIATAAYGTELAPQVQFLREVRDNTIMSTSSGAAFMTGFNQLYYSFSPTIADMERENPVFQETVRLFITPMISSLSIMTLAEDGNDSHVLGLGLSVIALNLGMYIAAPAAIGFTINRQIKSRK